MSLAISKCYKVSQHAIYPKTKIKDNHNTQFMFPFMFIFDNFTNHSPKLALQMLSFYFERKSKQ